MEKVAFYTLGCKVNQYETELMREQFAARGYTVVDFTQTADIYIINSCTVTAVADRKSRQAIGKAAKMNENAVIVVTGCFAQVSREDAAKIKNVDIVIGNNEKNDIVNIIEGFASEKITKVQDIMEQHIYGDSGVVTYEGKTRAFMKIQDGCDNYCAYCVIPYARGHRRSRSIENIVAEAQALADKGYKEIVLTGINLTSYGTETGKSDLTDVLLALHEINGIERIRLSSVEFNDVLLKIAQQSESFPKLCPHFHISLQSGSASVLKRMRRRYTPEQYKSAVQTLLSKWRGAAVTTDIIVGFPGESDEEFNETVEFAKTIGFAKIHIFPYSRRSGTPAAEMTNQIDDSVKKQRVKILQAAADEIKQKYYESCMGKTLSVLIERRLENGMYSGHAENYILTSVSSARDIKKQIVNVKITNYSGDSLLGVLSE